MAQKKLITRLETYLIVTVITILGWLYAEAKNAKEDTAFVKVKFVAPQMIVRPGHLQIAELKFQCAASKIEEAKRKLQDKPFPITVGQSVSGDRIQYEEVVDLLEWFQERMEIPEGVTILSAMLEQKRHVPVIVEPLTEVSVPIKVTHSGVDLAGPLVWKPSEAVLSMPTGLAKDVRKHEVIISAHLNEEFFSKFPVNEEKKDEPVALTFPPELRNEHIKNLPHAVKVTFTIRKQSEKLKVKRVPIKIELPMAALASYVTIETEDSVTILPEVQLSGPSHVISDIRDEKFKIKAYVTLSAEELNEVEITKTLQFFVPPGVTVDKPPVGTTVSLKITRQSSSPSTELDKAGSNP